MKEIKTNSFKKKADLIEHPPIAGEKDDSKTPMKKKKKKIYQLGIEIDALEDA